MAPVSKHDGDAILVLLTRAFEIKIRICTKYYQCCSDNASIVLFCHRSHLQMYMYESLPVMLFISPVFSVTPGSHRSSGGYSGCIPAYPTKGKGALGPLLSARKRETPTSNLTESTVV